jgi:hypothetical protein
MGVCERSPTLNSDLFVDTFFIVWCLLLSLSHDRWLDALSRTISSMHSSLLASLIARILHRSLHLSERPFSSSYVCTHLLSRAEIGFPAPSAEIIFRFI